MSLVIVTCDGCRERFPTPAHAKRTLCGCCEPRSADDYDAVPNLQPAHERVQTGVGIPMFGPGEGGE